MPSVEHKQIWYILSELYLDVPPEIDYIVNQLKELSTPVEEIEHILFKEVHLALHSNLLSVAGEWIPWDSDWLEEHISKSIKNYKSFKPWHLFSRPFIKGSMTLALSPIKKEWEIIKNAIQN